MNHNNNDGDEDVHKTDKSKLSCEMVDNKEKIMNENDDYEQIYIALITIMLMINLMRKRKESV